MCGEEMQPLPFGKRAHMRRDGEIHPVVFQAPDDDFIREEQKSQTSNFYFILKDNFFILYRRAAHKKVFDKRALPHTQKIIIVSEFFLIPQTFQIVF